MVTRQEYAKLSMEAYGNSAPAGWRIIERPDSTLTQSGFYAAAYQNVSTGEIVIAFRGTELSDLDDIAAGRSILFDSEHQQFVNALEFANQVNRQYGGPSTNITVTGHSLGGALAQLTADVFGWGGETFDAPGMEKYRDYTARSGIYLDTFFAEHPELSFGEVKGLHNYTVWGSAISSIPGAHIGTRQEVLTSDSSQGVVGLMIELSIGGDVAGVILAAANAGDQLGSHSMAGIYNHFRNLTQGGQFVSEYIEAVTSRGVMGYSTGGYIGTLTDYLNYLFGDEPPLSQEQAEFLLQDLETLKSQSPFSEPGNTALLDDLVKAQDKLRIAIQDIESVTVNNDHWSEQPGDNNELTVRIELQHALDQGVQWVRVDLPNTNPVTGEPMGYVVSSQNVRPVTRELGGVLSYTVVDYYLVRAEPGVNYAEFTLRALPDSDQDDNRLELGNVVVSLPGRDTPSHSLLLSIHEEEADANDTQTTLIIHGDLTPEDFNLDEPGIQVRYDELGNIITTNELEIDREDTLYDSEGNDAIYGYGGDDYINAWRGGDDYLDGGAGDDIVLGRGGDDIVIGGDGSDMLRGDSGNDRLYADQEMTLSEAFAALDAIPSGLQGDLMDSGNDNDILIGGTGNDAINGGQGDDLILGGAGDDNIHGDMETSIAMRGWSVTRLLLQENGRTIYQTTYNNIGYTEPVTGGNDVIYGGAGDDWISVGYGDDFVDGGADNDLLVGSYNNARHLHAIPRRIAA